MTEEHPPSLTRTQSQTNGKKPKTAGNPDELGGKGPSGVTALKTQETKIKRGSLDSPPRSPSPPAKTSTFSDIKSPKPEKKKASGFWSFFTGKKEKEAEKKTSLPTGSSTTPPNNEPEDKVEKIERKDSGTKDLEAAINKNLILDEDRGSNSESKEYNLSPEEVEALENSKTSSAVKRKPARERHLRFPCTCVEDLPKDLKKLARGTKISDEILDANLQSLLNVLHFVTKKVYTSSPSSGSTKLVKELEHKVDSNDQIKTPRDRKDSANANQGSATPHHYSSAEPKSKEGSERNSFIGLEATTTNSSGNDKKEEDKKEEDKKEEDKKEEDKKDEDKKEEDKKDSAKDENETKEGKTEEPAVKKSDSSLKPRETSSTPSMKRSASKVKKDEALDMIKNTNPKDIFKNLRKAGKGGFGTVFGAKSLIDGRKVAVKKMTHATRKERLDNFNEFRYTARCSGHANIVKMVSAYEWKDECWMVMEFLEGGTLSETRRGHEFEENEIAFVARELLRGLAYVHSMGFIHRDVKSENIMMSINGDIKLIDFGLCIENSLVRPTMVGSPFWMPPEMINRQAHSYAADIWSFGISILELANKLPPGSYNKVKMMFLTATVGKPKPLDTPEKWSPEFQDFISKCLEKDQDKRPLTAALLDHRFIEKANNTRRVMQKILSEIFLQKAIGLM